MGKKVWLDAGHGGSDPGACGGDLKEADITLAVVKKIGEILTAKGVEVFYSRTKDEYVALSTRSKRANAMKPDVFVSVHCNSASNINARGIETYCYKFKYRELADAIHKQLTADSYCYKIDRGVKEGDFHVIRETNMEAALVELAFISNGSDRWLLKNKQNQYAQAIANGIMIHLGMISDTVAVGPVITDVVIKDENNEETIDTVDNSPLYHVLVGNMKDKEEAVKLANLLKLQGVKNVMISVTAEAE